MSNTVVGMEVKRRIDYSRLIKSDRISSQLYTDPEIFEDELRKLWYRMWVYVGHSSEVPHEGDYVRRQIGLQPIVMIRNRTGEVGLLLNRCPHRGNVLCAPESGNIKSFRCVYHDWSFDLEGALRRITYPSGYSDGIGKDDFCMTKVPRVESYRGFVFGSFASNGPDLEEYLGEAATYLDRFCDLAPKGTVNLGSGILKTLIHANWKMPVEANVDGYHTQFLHRSALRLGKKEGVELDDAYGDDSRIVTRDLGGGHSMLDFSAVGGGIIQASTWAPSAEARADYMRQLSARVGGERASELVRAGTSNIVVFPNLATQVRQDVSMICPVGPQQTVLYQAAALLDGAPEEINRERLLHEMRSYGPAGIVSPDDVEAIERSQAGFNAVEDEWLRIGRGLHREEVLATGIKVGKASDETPMRSFWRRYLEVMQER